MHAIQNWRLAKIYFVLLIYTDLLKERSEIYFKSKFVISEMRRMLENLYKNVDSVSLILSEFMNRCTVWIGIALPTTVLEVYSRETVNTTKSDAKET